MIRAIRLAFARLYLWYLERELRDTQEAYDLALDYGSYYTASLLANDHAALQHRVVRARLLVTRLTNA